MSTISQPTKSSLSIALANPTSAAELVNLLNVTAGTVSASAAVVADANKDVSGIRHLTISGNLVSGSTTISEAELGLIDGLTAGTAAASKAVTLDANKKLTWAYNGTSPLTVTNTVTTAATSIDGLWTITATEVALGTYANAFNGKLNFGTAGSVTGLGGAVCAELDLGAGCSAGSYCCFEGEMVVASGGSTGTRTSFFSLNLSGSGASAFDSNGFLFDLNGITIGSGKLVQASAVTDIDSTHALKCQILGTTYYIPLHTAANFGG